MTISHWINYRVLQIASKIVNISLRIIFYTDVNMPGSISKKSSSMVIRYFLSSSEHVTYFRKSHIMIFSPSLSCSEIHRQASYNLGTQCGLVFIWIRIKLDSVKRKSWVQHAYQIQGEAKYLRLLKKLFSHCQNQKTGMVDFVDTLLLT